MAHKVPSTTRTTPPSRHTEVSEPRWWAIRPASNLKPATYRCPLCGGHLPSLSQHMLLAPEGDTSLRRHAHTACVVAARNQGRLPTKDEWRATQPREPSLFDRLFRRGG